MTLRTHRTIRDDLAEAEAARDAALARVKELEAEVATLKAPVGSPKAPKAAKPEKG